jgi:hypothetical protein
MKKRAGKQRLLNIKVNVGELRKLRALARKRTAGNVSALIRLLVVDAKHYIP